MPEHSKLFRKPNVLSQRCTSLKHLARLAHALLRPITLPVLQGQPSGRTLHYKVMAACLTRNGAHLRRCICSRRGAGGQRAQAPEGQPEGAKQPGQVRHSVCGALGFFWLPLHTWERAGREVWHLQLPRCHMPHAICRRILDAVVKVLGRVEAALGLLACSVFQIPTTVELQVYMWRRIVEAVNKVLGRVEAALGLLACSRFRDSDFPQGHLTTSCRRIPEAVAKVLGRIEAALGLLAQLLFGTGLPAESLIPLLRAAAAALTVERLDLLHVQASGDALKPQAARPGICDRPPVT